MRSLDLIRFSARALRVNPLRSALTTLGVIFGVGSVVLMVSIGSGTQQRISEEVERLGTNLLMVHPGSAIAAGVRLGAGSRPTISDDDADAIIAEVAGVAFAAPVVGGTVHVTGGDTNWSAPLLGITSDFFNAREWHVAEGREFAPDDLATGRKVALIGRTAADKLFEGGDPIGNTIRINHLPFSIIGVLQSKGQTLSGTDLDDVVMVPLNTARDNILGRNVAKTRAVGMILVKVFDPDLLETTLQEVRTVLRTRHRLKDDDPDDFQIRNLAETMQAREDLSSAMTQLLAAVASISLLVGGIGIMNIMLVSVTERTREIGVRMAVGAKPIHIMAQFLSEATFLSIAGGLAGALIGISGSLIADRYFGIRVLLTPQPVLLAFSFSALVGIVFGIYPAIRAAQQSPMASLRYE